MGPDPGPYPLQASQMNFSKGSGQGFAIFATGAYARAACDQLQHVRWGARHESIVFGPGGGPYKEAGGCGSLPGGGEQEPGVSNGGAWRAGEDGVRSGSPASTFNPYRPYGRPPR